MNTAPEQREHNSETAQPAAPPEPTTSDTLPASSPPIPSYEAATNVAPLAVPHTVPQDVALADELPDYTVVDSNQTTFMIYGTFIHNPNGPAYHLSSLLDAPKTLRLSKLAAHETWVSTTPRPCMKQSIRHSSRMSITSRVGRVAVGLVHCSYASTSVAGTYDKLWNKV
jgi:hypothetical protein